MAVACKIRRRCIMQVKRGKHASYCCSYMGGSRSRSCYGITISWESWMQQNWAQETNLSRKREGWGGACLPKVDKRGKYTMRARVAMPCTCAWQRHGRARGNAMGAFVAMPWACAWCIPLQSSLVPPWCQEITVSQDYCGYYTAQCCI